jgi:hypothetical protein
VLGAVLGIVLGLGGAFFTLGFALPHPQADAPVRPPELQAIADQKQREFNQTIELAQALAEARPLTKENVSASYSTEDLAAALKMGRLAPLPSSASGVRVQTAGNMFSRQFYVRFEADRKQLQDFLAASPGLKGIKPLAFDPSVIRSDGKTLSLGLITPDGYHYAFSVASNPWFTIERGAAYYVIPQDQDANYGFLILDPARGTVYLYVSHS